MRASNVVGEEAFAVLAVTAYFELNTTGYYGDHIKALRKLKGITYPRLQKLLSEDGTKNQEKPVTLDQIKQWAQGNVQVPAWAQDAVVRVLSLADDYFLGKAPSESVESVVKSSSGGQKSTKNKRGPGTFTKVRSIYVNEETNLKGELEGPPLHWIQVPDWFIEEDLYCARIDTEGWYPYVDFNDALVVRSNAVYRHGKMSLVTRKDDGKTFCVRAHKQRGKFLLYGPHMDKPQPSDLFWNDGLVLANLPDYIEGRLRVSAADEDGINADDLWKNDY